MKRAIINETMYKKILMLIENGYYDSTIRKPNARCALALKIMSETGLTTARALNLTMHEAQGLDVSDALRMEIASYYGHTNRTQNDPLIGGSSYGLQKIVRNAADYLGFTSVTPDSFRMMQRGRGD